MSIETTLHQAEQQVAALSRKVQQLDEDLEKCGEKIKNTELKLAHTSESVDESDR